MKTVFSINKFLSIIILVLLTACSSGGGDNDSVVVVPPPDPEPTLAGDYIGTWNSTTSTGATFTDFGISAKFTVNADETRLSGQFFATTSFTSCCIAGANDGTMTINIDSTTITSFSFTDTIQNCTGVFSGTGTINASGDLVIDFTGTDCDGSHVGQIILKKR